MPFITQGPEGEQAPYRARKTNWKFLVIVIILAVTVGGGSMFYLKYFFQPSLTYNLPPISPKVFLTKEECEEKTECDECVFVTCDVIPLGKTLEETCGKDFKAGWQCIKSTDETADWKTYRNEEYGFELSYPSKYIIQDRRILPLSDQEMEGLPTCYRDFYEATKTLRRLSDAEIRTSEEIEPKDRVQIDIRVYNNSNNLIINNWLDVWDSLRYNNTTSCDLKGTENIINREDFSLGTLRGIQGFSGCCGGCERQVFFSKNDKIYNVSLYGGNPGGKGCKDDDCCSGFSSIEKPIFNQMLSTFKFIEEFCGTSSYGSCVSNLDCTAGGCSGQVCQSKNEESMITTCEYKDCYNAQSYGLGCKCVDKKCQWLK